MADINWVGDGTDVSWSTPANWDGGVVPTASDDVIFDGTGNGNCTFPSSVPCASLTIDGYIGTISGTSSTISTNGRVYLNGIMSFVTQLSVSRTSVAGNTSDCEIGSNANIITPRFAYTRGVLFGSLEKINATRIDVWYVVSVQGTIKSRLECTSTGNATFTLKSGTRLEGELRIFKNSGTGVMNIIIEDDVSLFGDLSNIGVSDETIVVSGTLSLAGTADQSLESVENGISIAAQKTAGDVTLAAGTFNAVGDLNLGDGALVFAPNYSGTFTLGANTLSCNGFDTGTSPLTGSCNLLTGTVKNKGRVILTGFTYTQLLTETTTWEQSGGTEAQPNEWRMARTQYANRLMFAELTFIEGSVTTITGSSIAYFAANIRVYGSIRKAAGRIYNLLKSITFSETGSITGDISVTQYVGALQGKITEDTLRINSLTLAGSSSTATGVISCELVVMNEAAASVRISSPIAVNKLKLSSSSTGDCITHDLLNLTVLGDVVSEQPTAKPYSVPEFSISGKANQRLDLKAVTGESKINSTKEEGDIEISEGSLVILTATRSNQPIYNAGHVIVPIGDPTSVELHALDNSYFETDNLTVGHDFVHLATADLVVRENLHIRNRSLEMDQPFSLTLHGDDYIKAISYIGYNGVNLTFQGYDVPSIDLSASATIGWFIITADTPLTVALQGDTYAFDKSLGANVTDDLTNGKWILTNTNERTWSRADWVDTVLTTAATRGQI